MTSILVQLGKITIQAILVSVYLNPGETLTPYVLQNLLVPPLLAADHRCPHHKLGPGFKLHNALNNICLLYTSDAADDLLCVDLGGRRIIKKKKKKKNK